MPPSRPDESSDFPRTARDPDPLAAEMMASHPVGAGTSLYQSAVAMFSDRDDAARAIAELKASGKYSPSEIGVAMRDRDAQGALLHETGTSATGGAGAGAGAVSGGVLGGLAGWLIALGVITLPGIGPILAGGALVSAFGVTAGATMVGAGLGAAAGGLVGALIGLGFSEHDAHAYEKHFREGRVIVTIRARDISRAVELLEKNGGELRSTTVATPSRY
jgi:hypothetical protein